MSQDTTPTSEQILDGAGCVAIDLSCCNCGYNLRTQPVTGRCPECGHPVAETTAGYLPQLDREGRVAIDLPCVKCGYNVRTLAATGLCPECAAPVAPSTRGHYLHLAPPRWVKRLASGALLLIIAVGVAFAVPIAAILFGISTSIAGSQRRGFAEGLLVMFMIIAGVICLWLLVRGVIGLTAPDPAAGFRPEGFTARKLTRYCLLLLPLLILAGITLATLRPWATLVGFPPGGLGIIGILSLILYFTLPLALLRHVMALLRRIPRRGLIIYAKIEFWAILVSGILYVGGYAFVMIVAFRTLPAMAGGPNMPVPPYAAGPNAPSGPATTSAPAPTSLGYAQTGTTTVTYVGPGGATVTTTMPASVPVVMTPPTFGPLFILASISAVVGGCANLLAFIAGVVLLILVWRALVNAARLAEVHAVPE